MHAYMCLYTHAHAAYMEMFRKRIDPSYVLSIDIDAFSKSYIAHLLNPHVIFSELNSLFA